MKKLLSPTALFVYAAAIITFIVIKVKRRNEKHA